MFEFSGAFLAGGHVTSTIRKGIIDPGPIVDNPELLVYGMLAALLAAGIWLMVASSKGWPVSTTHSIVGAIVGFTMAGIGVDAVQWGKIGQIVASWVVSPVLGGAVAFLLMISIRKLILNTDQPFANAKKWGPVYVFLVGFIISLVTMFKGLKHLNLEMSVGMSFVSAIIIGLIIAAIGWKLINRVKVDAEDADRDFHFASVEKVFTPMMLFTACAMAFAHGSNDVANGIGPLAAVVSIVQSGGEVAQKAALPIWVLLLGGAAIVVGLATMGYRVMKTIGTKITELTPSRGYCATLAAATIVVLASRNRFAGLHHPYRRRRGDRGRAGPRRRRHRLARDRRYSVVVDHHAAYRRGPGGVFLLYIERYIWLRIRCQLHHYLPRSRTLAWPGSRPVFACANPPVHWILNG